MQKKKWKIVIVLFFAFVSMLFAADLISLPKLTPENRAKAAEIYDEECYACHRWTRNFAGPQMKWNIARYFGKPDSLIAYLKDPQPIHPDKYRPMEIRKLSDAEAALMVAWLFSLLQDSTAIDRPK